MLIFKEGFVRWGERVSSAMVWNFEKGTLPETNGLPLKIDVLNTTFLLGRPIFRGYVSFRGG